jgi:RNA polymerase sigma-70 factor (ECF subfamily)
MPSPANRDFATTRWSIVQAAGHRSTPTAKAALEELCVTYWPPVYAFVRQKGHAPADAEDVTQAFFIHVLESEFVATADPGRGRFRSFLLKSVSHFVSSHRRDQAALKRGGGARVLSLDFAAEEQQYKAEPTHSVTAEQLFERRWALTLLDNTMQQLRSEYAERNHSLLFESLEAHVNQDPGRLPYAELCDTLNMSEDAIKQAARRLKLRYRELLRTEIAGTVGNNADIDDELHQLLQALS